MTEQWNHPLKITQTVAQPYSSLHYVLSTPGLKGAVKAESPWLEQMSILHLASREDGMGGGK